MLFSNVLAQHLPSLRDRRTCESPNEAFSVLRGFRRLEFGTTTCWRHLTCPWWSSSCKEEVLTSIDACVGWAAARDIRGHVQESQRVVPVAGFTAVDSVESPATTPLVADNENDVDG